MGCAPTAQSAPVISSSIVGGNQNVTTEQTHSDVFVTPLNTANGGSFVDLGLVTAVCAQTRGGKHAAQCTAIEFSTLFGAAMETARLNALATIRKKCKAMGGNAILSIKFDFSAQIGFVTCAATGAAVLLVQNANGNNNNVNNANNSGNVASGQIVYAIPSNNNYVSLASDGKNNGNQLPKPPTNTYM